MVQGTPSDRVTGMLCLVSEPLWQQRLDVFEGEEYARQVVTATVDATATAPGNTPSGQVEAYAYIWVHGEQFIDLDKEWSTQKFMEEKESMWARGDEDRLDVAAA